MDELILRYLDGQATDVERHRVDKWRRASSDNEAWFQETQFLWDGLRNAAEPRESVRPDITSMLSEAERLRRKDHATRHTLTFFDSRWFGFGLAAAACLAVALMELRAWRVREVPPTR